MGPFSLFDRLVEIDVCGVTVRVPENNSLLRCFQFVDMESVSLGNYCWNGDCTNCRIWFKSPQGPIKSGLACRTVVQAGLVITALGADLQTSLRSAVQAKEDLKR